MGANESIHIAQLGDNNSAIFTKKWIKWLS
ncbi:hypothetical protein ACJJIQ_16070 [Microbulbifer sp. ANSA003]